MMTFPGRAVKVLFIIVINEAIQWRSIGYCVTSDDIIVAEGCLLLGWALGC